MARPDEFDLRAYGIVLKRRMRLIWIVTGSCVLIALLLNFLVPPIYQSTSVIEVRKDPNRSSLTGEAIAADQWQSDDIAVYTAAELITNRTLLRQVVEELDAKHMIPPPPFWAGWFGHKDPETVMGTKIDWLVSNVSIQPVRDTQLVDVLLQGDQASANRMNDILVDAFVNYQAMLRAAADSLRFNQLSHEMDETGKRVHTLERSLNTADEEGVPVLQEEAKQLTDGIAGLNDSYVKIQTDRLEAGARLERVRQLERDSLADIGRVPVQSDVIDQLWRDLLARQTELATARQVYKDGHPKIQMLNSEIASIRTNIRAELEKTIANLDQQHRVLVQREKTIQSAISQREARLRQVNARLAQQTTLQSEAKSTHDLYDLMSARIQQDQVSGLVRYPLVSVVQRATLDPHPVFPRKVLNLAVALLVGLTGGAGAALMLEYFRRTIRTPTEAMEQLELPILGIVPKHP